MEQAGRAECFAATHQAELTVRQSIWREARSKTCPEEAVVIDCCVATLWYETLLGY